MKRCLSLAFLSCTALVLLTATPGVRAAAPPSAATGADSLWQAAVALAGRNQNWVPGTLVTRFEELDGDGHPKSVEVTTVRLFLGVNGEPDSEIISSFKDGEDVTAKAREEADEEERKEAERRRKAEERRRQEREKGGAAITVEEREKSSFTLRSGGSTPFDPELQDSLIVRRVVAADPPAGGPYVTYEFIRRLDEQRRMRGTAWLAADTGVPAEIRFAPDPLPARVKELTMRVRFVSDTTGAWYPTEMSIKGMGKFLFFKKRFRSTTQFCDPWWFEPDSTRSGSADS